MQLVSTMLFGIAALHTVFGILYFSEPLSGLLADGIVNAAHGDPSRGHAIWFLYAGVSWALLAILARSMAELGLGAPRSFGWGLLLLAAVGAFVSPASGFWLVFVPAIVALRTGGSRLAARSDA